LAVDRLSIGHCAEFLIRVIDYGACWLRHGSWMSWLLWSYNTSTKQCWHKYT